MTITEWVAISSFRRFGNCYDLVINGDYDAYGKFGIQEDLRSYGVNGIYGNSGVIFLFIVISCSMAIPEFNRILLGYLWRICVQCRFKFRNLWRVSWINGEIPRS